MEELELFRLRAELVHETCLVLLGGARGLVSSGDDGARCALSLLRSYTALLAAEGEDELARGGARVVAVPAELEGDVKEAGELALVATEGVLGGAGDEVLGVANRVFGAVRESGAGAAVSEGTLERGGSGDEGGVVGVVVGDLYVEPPWRTRAASASRTPSRRPGEGSGRGASGGGPWPT